MKFKLNRDDEPKEIRKITIYIRDERYRLTESVDKKLNINKMSDGDSDDINVHPKCGNEIELS